MRLFCAGIEQRGVKFGALSRRLKFTVRRHTFNKDSISEEAPPAGAAGPFKVSNTPYTFEHKHIYLEGHLPGRIFTWKGIYLEGHLPRSQGQNLAVTVFHEPHSVRVSSSVVSDFEPSLDALNLRSDVISSIKIPRAPQGPSRSQTPHQPLF
jgi:hypothetical protein